MDDQGSNRPETFWATNRKGFATVAKRTPDGINAHRVRSYHLTLGAIISQARLYRGAPRLAQAP